MRNYYLKSDCFDLRSETTMHKKRDATQPGNLIDRHPSVSGNLFCTNAQQIFIFSTSHVYMISLKNASQIIG